MASCIFNIVGFEFCSTLILLGVSFTIANPGAPSDSLSVELTRPLLMTAFFSIIAGFVAGRGCGGFRAGAAGGALNAFVNLGLFLLVAGTLDRHFRAMGGPGLIVALPLALPLGALCGLLGAAVQDLFRPKPASP